MYNTFQYSCLEDPWTEEPDGLRPWGYVKRAAMTEHTSAPLPQAMGGMSHTGIQVDNR